MRKQLCGGCLLAVWLFVPGAARAQSTISDVANAVKELRSEIQAMRKEMASKTDVSKLVTKAEYERKIAELEGELGAIKAVLNTQVAEQEQILEAIAGKDSQNRPTLALRGLMQNEEFRADMADAVHRSLRREGTLRVSNETSSDRYLLVNGRSYRIPALTDNYEITVPVGTLTTELEGYEAARNWTIGPPNYSQSIRIHYGRHTALRPVEQVQQVYREVPVYRDYTVYRDYPVYREYPVYQEVWYPWVYPSVVYWP